MNIRKMLITDYSKVYDLWINSTGMGLNNLDDSQIGITRFLKRNPNTCYVALDNNEIVGVILCGHDGRRAYIYHTFVEVNHRNKGIGSALVDKVLKSLKDEGINKVALVVFSKNDLGNAFWERLGFTIRNDLNYRNKSLTEMVRIDT
jgi:ribosomal protein S18 acetylase RimI-like enzyme